MKLHKIKHRPYIFKKDVSAMSETDLRAELNALRTMCAGMKNQLQENRQKKTAQG